MKQIYLLILTILLSSIYSLDAQTTGGKDFWLTFGKNWREGTGSNCSSQETTPVVPRIRIVGKDSFTTGEIVFTNLPVSSNERVIPFSIPALEVFETGLTENQKNASFITSQGISNLSIHITCNNDVTVYVLNQCCKSADATNILPVPTLGMEYYQISYQPQGYDANYFYPNQDAFAVIATEDNTTVNQDGIPLATLNVGQVYYRTDENDMTGSHVTSDKPVAFFALCQGTYIKNSSSRDVLFQQLATVNTWGKNFLVPVTNIFGNSTVERVRIVASQDNTTITRTGGIHISAPNGQTGPTYNLNTGIGQYIEIEVSYSNNGCYIETDKPVGVCTYLTTPDLSEENSDPAQAWLPSMEQTTKSALLAPFVPPEGTTSLTTHHVLIIAPTSTKNDTKVTIGTGEPEDLSGGGWRDNAASNMSFYNFPMTNTTESYIFNNPEGLITMGYGYGPAESYYYLAYSAMRNLKSSFYANDIYYQELETHLFCENKIQFHAEIETIGVEIDSIKWYINDVEEISAQNKLEWEKTFSPDEYNIKMWVLLSDEDETTLEGILNIGAIINATPSPQEGGNVTGDGCYKVNEMATLTAIPNNCYEFANWTEDGQVVSTDSVYSFIATQDRILIANFTISMYNINVDVNNRDYGNATGAQISGACTDVKVEAFANQCYRFANWTIDSVVVSNDNPYLFTVSENTNIIANFYALDFDAYAVTICNKVILLNLKKLAEDGYEVTDCKWFKNGTEVTDTHTGNKFSYSEGGDKELETEPTYYTFRIITEKHGELCSFDKFLIRTDKAPNCPEIEKSENLLVYPNPVFAGNVITLEGVVIGSSIDVYNHIGACVFKTIATDTIMKITLDLPQGIYLVHNEDKIVKVLIIK